MIALKGDNAPWLYAQLSTKPTFMSQTLTATITAVIHSLLQSTPLKLKSG
jgi:hypothetical protein